MEKVNEANNFLLRVINKDTQASTYCRELVGQKDGKFKCSDGSKIGYTKVLILESFDENDRELQICNISFDDLPNSVRIDMKLNISLKIDFVQILKVVLELDGALKRDNEISNALSGFNVSGKDCHEIVKTRIDRRIIFNMIDSLKNSWCMFTSIIQCISPTPNNKNKLPNEVILYANQLKFLANIIDICKKYNQSNNYLMSLTSDKNILLDLYKLVASTDNGTIKVNRCYLQNDLVEIVLKIEEIMYYFNECKIKEVHKSLIHILY